MCVCVASRPSRLNDLSPLFRVFESSGWNRSPGDGTSWFLGSSVFIPRVSKFIIHRSFDSEMFQLKSSLNVSGVMRAACPAHFILLVLVAVIIFRGKCKSMRIFFCFVPWKKNLWSGTSLAALSWACKNISAIFSVTITKLFASLWHGSSYQESCFFTYLMSIQFLLTTRVFTPLCLHCNFPTTVFVSNNMLTPGGGGF